MTAVWYGTDPANPPAILVDLVALVAFATAVAPIVATTCAAVAAVNADVPLPCARPVSVATPVPPLDATKVPARVMAPVDAVAGVNPVVPPENEDTPVPPPPPPSAAINAVVVWTVRPF